MSLNLLRSDPRRIQRKVIQLSIDILTFIGSSSASIAVFLIRAKDVHMGTFVLIGIEALSMVVLAWQIVAYADLKKSPLI
jgi:nicotinamide riboside transporter PnuC